MSDKNGKASGFAQVISLADYRRKKEALRKQRRRKRKTILPVMLRMNHAMRKRFFRAKRYTGKVFGEKIESNNDFVLIALFTYITECESELKRSRSRLKKRGG